MTGVPKAVRYLLGGVMIGGFWYLNRHRPPWEEALRTIAVFAVLMAVLKARLKRARIDVHLIPLVASKAVIVIAAALIEQRLEHSASDPANVPLFVGLGLAAAVTLLGPFGDRHYFSVLPQQS
ncbi:hypothetical protein KGQ20_13520 [Catenulispora sp. NF23]|uniref:Uncharacterized protein n=1 Tax=Catenulispora pinistramenti TaxID=2705254 RepID=A0ABS5KU38_9ACTN|nr:hypothetical protein [Catenulispora pinistramenti]MBS2533788.1 hypothetical protein [Catenulispora pinistramenti]MBS2549572.1 hypothetical protein [Catenulispora pinistramenti]